MEPTRGNERRTAMRFVAIMLCLTVLGACTGRDGSLPVTRDTSGQDSHVGDGTSPPGDRTAPPNLGAAFRAGGGWELIGGEGPEGDIDPIERAPITLIIRRNGAGGYSGCNHYGARGHVQGSTFQLRRPQQTLMGCGSQIGAVEETYLDALHGAETIEVGDGILVLRGPHVELRYRWLPPPPTDEVVDIKWSLKSLIREVDRDAKVVPAYEGGWLVLRSNGRFRAHTGCSPFWGRWAEEGGHIEIVEKHTPRGCRPREKRAQDQQMKNVISRFLVELDGELTLIHFRGAERVVFSP